jgi:hypothetical protein
MDRKMAAIPGQLSSAACVLPNANHFVFSIGGNDMCVADSLLSIIS